ncbi:MAG: MFS transporter [Acidimicrobiaceae bacterium]|nr:MFS transporter [Acidimicrobiaceae bacterium]
MMPLDRWTGALKERNFRLFFIGQTASQVGTGMAPVAIVFAVLAHGTATDVGYVLAAETTPLVILLLIGGVVGDRVSRRKLMLQSDTLRTLAECTLGLWVLLGRPPLWGFLTLGALMGIGQAFFSPALTAIVPQMLSPQKLQQGNALNGISASSGRMIGPAIAGVIVAVSSPGWAILIDGLTYLVSVVSLACIRIDWNAAEVSVSFVTLLRQGWKEFWSRSWLWAIVLQSSLVNALFASFLVLGPVVAKQSLSGAPAWGAILAAEGAGSVVGGVVMLRVHPRRPLLVATLCSLVFPLPLFFLAGRAPTILVTSAGFLAGGFITVFAVQWSTTLQREIPSDVLSRVSAYDWFGSLVLLPIGMALAGPLAATVGITTTLVASGGLMVLLILAVLAVPSVIRLRAPTPE